MANKMAKANEAFYEWACELITSPEFKSILKSNGMIVDLRQADLDNTLECFDAITGEVIILEC